MLQHSKTARVLQNGIATENCCYCSGEELRDRKRERERAAAAAEQLRSCRKNAQTQREREKRQSLAHKQRSESAERTPVDGMAADFHLNSSIFCPSVLPTYLPTYLPLGNFFVVCVCFNLGLFFSLSFFFFWVGTTFTFFMSVEASLKKSVKFFPKKNYKIPWKQNHKMWSIY